MSVEGKLGPWWCTTVISELRRLRQEEFESEAKLGYTHRTGFKKAT